MYEFIILQLVVLSIASHDMAFPFQVVNFTFSLGAYVVRAAGAGEETEFFLSHPRFCISSSQVFIDTSPLTGALSQGSCIRV